MRGRSDGGGTRVPQRWWEQPGIDWRLVREKNERAEAAGETYKKNCRYDNGDVGDRDIRIGKGNGGGGVTGGQWIQWGGMERGGRLRHNLFPTTGDTQGFQVAN